MDEFELIRQHFKGLTTDAEGVILGIGDDCALLAVTHGHELAVTTDSLVAGRHFPLDTRPFDIGWKSLAVSLSDLAAMGAQPRWFILALTLEQADPKWLAEFARGLRELATQHRVALIGGDTTRGPLNISVTAMGLVPCGRALRRDGAQAGDAVCVTGTLGDAALALREIERSDSREDESAFLRGRLDRPVPRVAAGLVLRDLANAAVDLSDGLAGDLNHILEASGVGAVIQADKLPGSPVLRGLLDSASCLPYQVTGGDDYELCVCLPSGRVEAARARLDVPLTVIGHITAEPGLRFVDAAGATIAVPPNGYRHFE
ncbi:MAG: thiamine-phosphate kinase [Panacagrimonas sp.]